MLVFSCFFVDLEVKSSLCVSSYPPCTSVVNFFFSVREGSCGSW